MTEKKLRGFALLKAQDPERLRQIATRGGHSVKPANRAYSRDPELAVAAGRKGGAARAKQR